MQVRLRLEPSTASVTTLACTTPATSTAPSPNPWFDGSPPSKSRSDGYAFTRTEREWSYVLSGPQYNILRSGGTESPNTSPLVKEKRRGAFACAGCATPLFESSQKFESGTGWPSFAAALPALEAEASGAGLPRDCLVIAT